MAQRSLPVLRLEGECNRCGQCCTVMKNGMQLRCHNLRVDDAIGMPGATYCRAWEIRYPGMSIMMLRPDGVLAAMGMCLHGSSADDINISQWIGKGCSLRIAKE